MFDEDCQHRVVVDEGDSQGEWESWLIAYRCSSCGTTLDDGTWLNVSEPIGSHRVYKGRQPMWRRATG